jgi:hypothetical protein
MARNSTGRAPVTNPARRIVQVATRAARVEMNGTSGAGRVSASPAGPTGHTLVHTDGQDITTFLTELDYTESEYALTAESGS